MTQQTYDSVKEYFVGRRKKEDSEQATRQESVWISTGCDVFDMVTGGGIGYGVPSGKIINIVGDKSSGKSFICTEIIASSYHKYGKNLKWVYDDCESGFTFDTQKLYGFEIMPIDDKDRFKSGTVQELYGNVRKFSDSLKQDEFGIYVVDSLDGLSSDELDDMSDKRYNAFKAGKEFNKGSYKMESAKFLSQEFFKTLSSVIHDKNILVIFVSQIRYNIDPLSFEKYSRSGGKALDFYCYAVVWLNTMAKIEKKERAIGVVVRARTTKLKAPRPFRECTFSILFEYGIDNIGSSLDYLYDLRGKRGELIGASKAIQWNEGEEEVSRDELIDRIESEGLQNELRKRVIKKWEDIEDSIKITRKGKYE